MLCAYLEKEFLQMWSHKNHMDAGESKTQVLYAQG